MSVSFEIDPAVLSEYPEAQVRFVVAYGLHIAEPWAELQKDMSDLERRIRLSQWRPYNKEDERIGAWRDAYRTFGTNPNRMRPSVEALSRRLGSSGRLPRINPAVDAYNLMSVTFGLPAGAFDLDKIAGDVQIRFAVDGDTFSPLGEPNVVERPNNGEVIYAQKHTVLTRHWNYRDADVTKVTQTSSSVVFILERVSSRSAPVSVLAEAQRQLAKIVESHAAEVICTAIDIETPHSMLRMDEPGLTIGHHSCPEARRVSRLGYPESRRPKIAFDTRSR